MNAPQATETVILPYAEMQKKAERDGVDIMVYVNSMHTHVLNQRKTIKRLAAREEELRTEVASWKAVAHDHSERLKKLDKPYHERAAPHCSTCECGADDVGDQHGS